jgi:type II secretory pathway component GspD/PulD (secretin)
MANNSLSGSSETAGMNLNWYPYVSGTKSLQTSFQWVLSGQDAKVLTSPNLVISRNEEASLSTGQDIPIQEMSTTSSGTNIATTFRRVGVTLTLESMIINYNLITLRVAPEVSTVQQYQKINQGYDSSTGEAISFQVPVISIRNLETTLTLRDGEVLLMGGLYSNRTSMQEDRTPLLSDLPYLGELFTAKKREQEIVQLVFFMRVHILRPMDEPSGIVFDPDEVAETSNKIGNILQNSPSFPKLKSTLEQLRHEFIEEPERRRVANEIELNKARAKEAQKNKAAADKTVQTKQSSK